MCSQRNENTSLGRIPVPSMIVAHLSKAGHSSEILAHFGFREDSFRCRSPFARVIFDMRSSFPH